MIISTSGLNIKKHDVYKVWNHTFMHILIHIMFMKLKPIEFFIGVITKADNTLWYFNNLVLSDDLELSKKFSSYLFSTLLLKLYASKIVSVSFKTLIALILFLYVIVAKWILHNHPRWHHDIYHAFNYINLLSYKHIIRGY